MKSSKKHQPIDDIYERDDQTEEEKLAERAAKKQYVAETWGSDGRQSDEPKYSFHGIGNYSMPIGPNTANGLTVNLVVGPITREPENQGAPGRYRFNIVLHIICSMCTICVVCMYHICIMCRICSMCSIGNICSICVSYMYHICSICVAYVAYVAYSTCKAYV